MSWKFAIATITGLALAACASTPDGEKEARGIAAYDGDVRLGEEVDRVCLGQRIDSFYNNKRDTVVLSCGGSNDYLVAVAGNCFNLRNAGSIGIDSNSGLLRRGDSLIVSENAFSVSDSGGIGPDRCMISSIYKWDKRAKA